MSNLKDTFLSQPQVNVPFYAGNVPQGYQQILGNLRYGAVSNPLKVSSHTQLQDLSQFPNQQNNEDCSSFGDVDGKSNLRMIVPTSHSRFGIKMGSSSGYPAYPSSGVPGLGLPPPVPNPTEYRDPHQQQYLMSHHMHSLPTPQPQPLGKF